MDSVVLLLNADYEPLNVCDLRRAFRLVFGAKAEVIEYDHTEVRTPTEILRAPSVIKLQYRIKRPRPRVRLSRREVFARDGHSCQYCGQLRPTSGLSIDHVLPRSRGGSTSWDNCVLACVECNHRKAARTPERAGMPLRRKPTRPIWNPSYARHGVRLESWSKFVSDAYWNVELEE